MSLLEDLKSLLIPFGDIKEATKNFTTEIGKGGYGHVYKGELLLSGKLTTVAVKRLHDLPVGISGQGLKEFLTELQLLTRYKHPNLISLIGFCNEGEENILIYEYAKHGSLDKYLSTAESRRTLTWKRRLDICVDAARGLNFLHNEAAANERVIHRDIKSANVLLDENWKAMISDLGLSKLGRANENVTYLITNACGTDGYCDPVYRKSGILTKESDVYSFGVVLFEVLCGRLSFIDVHNESRFLPELAQSCYKKGQINEIMDPELQNQVDSDSLKKFSQIAFKCIHNTRKQRPSMRWVLKKLEELEKILHSQLYLQQQKQRQQEKIWGASSAGDGSMSISFRGNDQAGRKRKQPVSLLDDIVEDGSFDDNVHALLSHDDTDMRDTVDVSKDFTFTEVNSVRASQSKVVCCHFSSDGKLLVSGGHDKKAVLWYADSLKPKTTLEEHTSLITDVRFSSSVLPRLATSSFDKSVRLWDVDNPGYSLRIFMGHSASVISLDFHPNKDDLICSCDGEGEIRYWSVDKGSCAHVFKGATTQVRFQPRHGRFLAAAAENIVSILDVETQAILYTLPGLNQLRPGLMQQHKSFMQDSQPFHRLKRPLTNRSMSLDIPNDGSKSPISLYLQLQQQLQQQKQRQQEKIWGASSAGDGSMSTSFRGNDQAGRKRKQPVSLLDDIDHFLENVHPFLSHDDTDMRDTVDESEGFTFTEVNSVRASASKVVCCHFSADGKLLASGGHDKKAVVWYTDSLKPKTILEDHTSMISDVRFSLSSRLATSSFDKSVRLWDVDNPGYSLRTFMGHSAPVISLDFHPNKDDLICSCDGEGEIRYWSVNSGSCDRVFKGATAQVRFQPQHGRFLAAAAENIVSILDVETQAILYTLPGYTKPINSVCWDPSGEYLASVSDDSVRVWSLTAGNEGECVHDLSCSGNEFHSCVFHPSYASLLVIGCYQSLELWNMPENKTMTLSAHEGLIAGLAMSTRTGMLASASHNKIVKVWK
uniref:uncharacterized protein LOC122581101 isoform X2 n=1 Tax=Erigeron canadensis TaxID=72917 RepID=UPI001CB96A22|nr:uncharacterized protein LOC122581101 isoform X2 [Erigeron canadensis]